MSRINPGDTDSFPLLSETKPPRVRGGKPSANGWTKSLTARFATFAHFTQGTLPDAIGINKEFWSSLFRTKDPELISYLLVRAVPWLMFLGSFVVYLITAAPTVFGFDSAEYASAAYNLGVPHATGYPLYVLMGKLFTYLPFGDVGYRLNLMSAFLAASTVTVVYLLALFVTRRIILSIAIAGFLAFSYYFWSSAVVTEVYSLHALLNAIAIYLLLQWNRGGSDRLLYGGVFVWGLSFGNHMTTVLLGPAIAFFVVVGLWRQRIKWPHLALLAVCFVVPLAVYVYLPLRYLANAIPHVLGYYTWEGVLVRTNTASIEGFWSVLSARQFEVFLFAFHGMDYVNQLGQVFFWVYANFLGVGLVLGILGIFRNYLVDKLRLVFLGLIFLANLLFFASYGATDKPYMAVANYIVWSIWMADGLYYLTRALENFVPLEPVRKLAGSLSQRVKGVQWEKLSLALPIIALWVNFSYADLSSFTYVRDTYPRIMESFEPNALVLAWWPDAAPMFYFQQVEKLRPDVQIIDRFLISAQNENRLIASSARHRPVYVFGKAVRVVPNHKYEALPSLAGSVEKGYKVIPP
jgi:hypothetical protein